MEEVETGGGENGGLILPKLSAFLCDRGSLDMEKTMMMVKYIHVDR